MKSYRLAICTVFATFCLLIAGGLVHATDSGLACPDWPTCYGTLMPEMKGGILFEHSHRLIATFVGCLTIALAISVHRSRRGVDPVAVQMGWAALVLVIVQGVLGGMTVIYRLPTAVSTTHLATAMVYFCTVIALTLRLRPRRQANEIPGSPRYWIGVSTLAVYLQMLLGALVRHTDVGLACTDLPLCRGSLWLWGADPRLQLHMAHRLGALVVTLLVVVTAVQCLRRKHADPLARVLAMVAPSLVVFQVGLGMLSVHTALEPITVTAHLATGALLLGANFALFLLLGQPPMVRT